MKGFLKLFAIESSYMTQYFLLSKSDVQWQV